MSRVICILFVNLCVVHWVCANNLRADSLKAVLHDLRPAQKLPVLIELGKTYLDSAKFYHETKVYLDEALSIIEKGKNDSLKIAVFNYYGLTEFYNDNYEQAVLRFFSGITMAEQIHDQAQLSKLYNNLGMTFDEIQDYENAVFYYKKSLAIDSISGNEKGMGMSYLNLAISFQNLEKLDSAYLLNMKAMEILEKHEDSISLINIINNLGTVEYDRKNYEESLEYYIRAQQLYQEINDEEGIATVLNNIGLVYLDKKQYDEALPKLKAALKIARELQITDFIGDIYSNLSMYYEKKGDYKNAFFYYNLYHTVYDSILGKSKNNSIRKIEAQYRLDKKQMEIVSLQQRNTDQEKSINMNRSIQFYLYIIIFLVLVLLFTGYYLFRKERKLSKELQQKTKELKRSNQAKDKFFSIIAHDLKNPFNALISYTSLLKTDIERFTKSELSQILNDLNNATERGFNLLENLLYWTRSQTNRIKIYKTLFNLHEVVEDIKSLAESNLEEKSQELKIEMDKELKIYADKDMVATVIRNLVFNSIKFSNPETVVIIEAEKLNQKVQISVIDQGIGIAPENHMRIFNYEDHVSTNGTKGEIGSGLGLVICREFVENNGGMIWVESQKGEGATFRFTIPLAEPATSSNV